MTRWDLARQRQQQAPRRYTPVAPVGRDVSNTVIAGRPLPQQDQRFHKNWLLTDGFGGQYFKDGSIVRGEFPACADCGHQHCSCPPPKEPPLRAISETGSLSTLRHRMEILEGLKAHGMLESTEGRAQALDLLLTGDANGKPEEGP